MKAFRFQLDQARRWREAQVNLQKASVAVAAGQLAQLESAIQAQRCALENAGRQTVAGTTGSLMQSYAAFRAATTARLHEYESQAIVARQNVTLEMNRLIEANQKLGVIEKLKSSDYAKWRSDFDRELAAFADEAFLSQRK
jgi:flagellar biosynthesis chaperone FliJ